MKTYQKLQEQMAHLELLKHPFYQAWNEGNLSINGIRDYASRYYKHVEAFPRYISAIHSICENKTARKILLENLNDEEGFTYTPHPELWMNFAKGLGANEEEVQSSPASPAIENLIQCFFKNARQSYARGLGALYAYEYQVPEVAETKIKGLTENYHITEKKSLEFFEVHKLADKYHRAAIEELLEELSTEEQAEAIAASKEIATCLWEFLTEAHENDQKYVA